MTTDVKDCSKRNESEMCFNIQINTKMKKMNSTLPNQLMTQIKSSDKILKEFESEKSILQCRYIVAFLSFFIPFQVNAYRISTSIAIVSMVNNSAAESHKIINATLVSCLSNISDIEDYTIPETDGEFDWSPAIQGYILGASFFGFFLTQIPGGLLAEAYGAKPTIVSGLFISAMCHLITPFAAWSSCELLIAIQFFRGFGQGLMPAALSVLDANWFPNPERGFLNSLVVLGYPVGAMITGFSTGSICSSFLLNGWPSVYYIYGSLGLVLCFCFHAFLYESPKFHPRIKDKELTYILQNQEIDLSGKRPPTPWKQILTSLPVYALVYAAIGSFWIGAHFLSVQPIFYGTILHFTIQENGFYTSLPFIFQTLFTLASSWISKWLTVHNYAGVSKVRKGCNFTACFGYSICLLGVYYAECNRVWSNVLSIAAMSFVGFSFTGVMITTIDMSPTFAGTITGLMTTIASISSVVFPVIVGIMTNEEQTLEQWNKIFMLCIGVVMSSGIFFCVFGAAEVQPWNFPSTDETKKNNKVQNKVKY